MRILRVAQTVYPESKGGGAYHVHAMSRDQAAMGHDVTVVTTDPSVGARVTEQRAGYTIERFPTTVSVLGNHVSVGLGAFLRRVQEFDVVHAHSHLYFSTNLAAVARWLDETPLAITNHGLYSQNAPERLFDAYLSTIGRWTFNQADTVFCYTNEDSARLRELGVTTLIETVANGIDTSRFTPDGPASDLIDHDGPVILFVGRLVDGKRPQDAIEAVESLPDDLDAHLFVVGDGPLRSALEQQADPDRVTFLGHVPYDEMPQIYRAGDALLLPSRAEGLPRTVLESFASGIPVVSSRLEQTAPVVEQAGKTAAVGDVQAFSDALCQVLTAGEDLGETGRRLTVDRFQWQETVEATTDVLASLR